MQVFWPCGIRDSGFVFGWELDLKKIVVAGVHPFPSKAEAHDTLSEYREAIQDVTKPLKLLGEHVHDPTYADSLPHHISWYDNLVPSATTITPQFLLYSRPDSKYLRYLSFDAIDLYGNAEKKKVDGLGERLIRMNSLSTWSPSDSGASLGLDSEVLGKINAAMLSMRIISGQLSKRQLKILSTTINEPEAVEELSPGLAAVEKSISDASSLFYLKNFATPQQLQLRLHQYSFLIRLASKVYRRRAYNGFTNVHVATRYMRLHNYLWLILNDMIIGSAFGHFLYSNRRFISSYMSRELKIWSIEHLQEALAWLDSWPAGLKLNSELSSCLRMVSTSFVTGWHRFILHIDPFFILIVTAVSFCGPLGFTLILSLSLDICGILLGHCHSAHGLLKLAVVQQLRLAGSLFNLFRGKRYNTLRNRVDSWNYDIDQLLLGTMLFALTSFLFPTVVTYYALFALIDIFLRLIRRCIDALISFMNGFPLFALTTRLKDPERLPGGVEIVIASNDTGATPTLLLKNSPVSYLYLLSPALRGAFRM